MMQITVDGVTRKVEEGTTLEQVAKQYGKCENGQIVLAYQNRHLCELFKPVKEHAQITFVCTSDKIGIETYRRSMVLMMLKAFRDVLKEQDATGRIRVLFSLSKGLYCELNSKQVKLSQELLEKVTVRMQELVDADLPIEKHTYNAHDLVKRFSAQGRKDKVQLFKYRRASNANAYLLEEFEDYYYGFMVPSTGYLKYFALYLYEEGFVLQMPARKEPCVVPEFRPQNKLFQVLKQSDDWGVMLNVDTVGGLNDAIASLYRSQVQVLLQRHHFLIG